MAACIIRTGLQAPRVSCWSPSAPCMFRPARDVANRQHIKIAAAGASPAGDPSPSSSTGQEQKPGFLGRIKKFFVGDKLEKEKLAALGMSAFASYGVISNITYGICLTIAWVSFVKATGTSPLAPDQWKPFLAFYAGLWTIQNFVRPARFALAIALAPFFERFIGWIGAKARAPKPVAFGILMVIIAACTTAGLGSAIALLAPGSLAPLFNKAAVAA